MRLRRARGVLLRLARHRRASIAVGVVLAAPAVWVELSGGSGVWWIDGLSLLVASTGAALIWTGLTGPREDWVD